MKDLFVKFVEIAKEEESVDASKYRAFKLKQWLCKDYPQLVFLMPKKRNISEIVYVENLDSSGLVEEHMLYASDESDGEMDEEDCLSEHGVCDKVSCVKRYPETNKLEVLYNAVLILKQKVEEIPKLDLPWPPLASNLTMDNVKKVVPHEHISLDLWTFVGTCFK